MIDINLPHFQGYLHLKVKMWAIYSVTSCLVLLSSLAQPINGIAVPRPSSGQPALLDRDDRANAFQQDLLSSRSAIITDPISGKSPLLFLRIRAEGMILEILPPKSLSLLQTVGVLFLRNGY